MQKTRTLGYTQDIIDKLEGGIEIMASNPEKYKENIQENIWRMILEILDLEKKAKELKWKGEKNQSLKMAIQLRFYKKKLTYLLVKA